MMPNISILCPTRNRYGNVVRLLESAFGKANGPIEVVLYVDDDDPTREQVAALGGGLVTIVVGPRIVLSEAWNRCFDAARADVLMQCGDDIIFQTLDWDGLVLSEFEKVPDKLILVHGRDGIQDARLGTHSFLHRRWVDVVGYFVPPYFASDYNDAWLTEVADAIGRRVYVPALYTEHMHPVVNKGPLDQTHLERLDRHRSEDCDGTWLQTAYLRQRDIAKLQDVIERVR